MATNPQTMTFSFGTGSTIITVQITNADTEIVPAIATFLDAVKMRLPAIIQP